MKKIESDGKVAVLYAPGYGAGWSTWNDTKYRELLCMDSDVVQAVLDNNRENAAKIAAQKIKEMAQNEEVYVCVLGAEDLEVEWVSKGAAFEITEYDGSESVNIITNNSYMIA
jgi:hypothetical protein